MGCTDILAISVQDTVVDGILRCNGELCLGAAQAALPLNAVKVFYVLHAERVVCEEVFCNNFDDASEDLPASWAEVRAKSKATLQVEQIIDDERKQAQTVGVVLELPKQLFTSFAWMMMSSVGCVMRRL